MVLMRKPLVGRDKRSWSSFLKSIANFSGDLSAMTAPPFILRCAPALPLEPSWGWPADAESVTSVARTARRVCASSRRIGCERLLRLPLPGTW